MENIFSMEEQVIEKAEKLLDSHMLETEQDAKAFKVLLDEYKKLLKQMMTLIKISDLNHSELSSISKRFEIASNIDDLTGIYNRRYFNEIYHKEWLSAVRCKSPLALIMVDIDHFKEYNDVYGHLHGDSCLKAVSGAIRNTVQRPRDVVARYGGDELVLLLPETGMNGSLQVANRILANVESLDIGSLGIPVQKKVTVSIGVAMVSPNSSILPSDLINMSDTALYRAKAEGRNCYRIYE